MNITVYNQDKKYNIRYRPDFNRVIEGVFEITDENNKVITLSDKNLYEIIFNGLKESNG